MKKSNLLITVLIFISSVVFGQLSTKDTNIVQLTFNYPLGTNGFKSYQISNNLSVNMFIGFNGGVKGCEFAGLGNINNGDVTGLQASGLMNLVRGNVTGAQFSGLFNASTGSAKGIQSAGLFNFNTGNSEYLQAAGLFNSNYGKANGLQAAGLINSNLCQTDDESVKLAQVAGIINQNSSVTTGLQVSGILNVSTDSLTGFQSSLVNLGSYVKGVQIGLVNVCTKNSEKVIPIGLVNIVKGGLYELELTAGDAIYANLNFKMGVERFYTIYKVGYTVNKGESVYSFGLGVGTYFKLNDKSKIALDFSTNSLSKAAFQTQSIDMLNKIDLSYKYAITNNFSIFAGPSFNVYIAGNNNENERGILNVPYTISKSSNTYVDTFNWLGLNAGISLKF